MKTLLLTILGATSLFLISCEMGDVNVNDFLNDMTIGDQGDDQETENQGYCGDGIIQWELDENCDDGNNWWGDGCNEYCWVEYGWYCPNPGEPCYYYGNPGYCGDGIVQWDLGEQCDDGNWDEGDGCTSWCTIEYNYYGCYDNGEYHNVGDTWWVDESTYCSCMDWNEITCYGEDLGGCQMEDGTYYQYGDLFWNEEGVLCQCLGIYGMQCDIYIV